MTLASIGVAVYLGLIVVFFPKWTVDDAYILFRYAQNFVETGQLTWNPGHHPIEGYTGIALVLLVAGATKLGVSPIVASQAIGTASFVVGGLLLWRLVRRLDLVRPVRGPLLLLYVAAPFFVPIAFCGLETMLFSTVILAGLSALYTCLVSPSRQPAHELKLYAVLLLAGLVRPEGALLGGLALVGLALAKRGTALADRRRFVLLAFVAYVLPGLAYFLWRWSYYDLLLPNTFYAKSIGAGVLSFEGSTLWDLQRFFELYLIVPLAGALLWALVEADATWARLRGGDKARAALRLGLIGATFTAICILQYARTALEMNFSFRFFAPFFPIVLLSLGMVANAGYCSVVSTRIEKPLRFQMLRGVSLFLIVLQLLVYAKQLRAEGDYVSWYRRLVEDEYVAAGRFIRAKIPESEWLIVLYDAGATPYYSRLPTVDFGGLNDPTLVRLQRLGRMRDLIDYFFSFRPGVAVFTSRAADHVTHSNRLSAAIVSDERFRDYALVRRFSTEVARNHLFVFFRRDLVGRAE